MAVLVVWDNESKTALRYEYQGRWTWEEVYRAVEQGYQMVDAESHPVAAIIDMTGSEGTPPGAISHGRSIQQKAHPRMVMNVTVNAGGFLTTLANTYFKLYGAVIKSSSTYFVSSISEARRVVAEKMPAPDI